MNRKFLTSKMNLLSFSCLLCVVSRATAFIPAAHCGISSLRASKEVTDWDKLQPSIKKNTEKVMLRDDPEWKFFDTARINVSGGCGGNGCVAFRREKGVAMGGPSGGRGGNGGSIYLVCDEGLNTLAPARNRVHVRARNGNNGTGKSRDGSHGNDEFISVPPGTVVRELLTQKVAGELKEHGEQLLVARGGRGGRGNAAFKTNRNTAPKLAERGEPGASRWLSLELKLVADVGFLGKPNAGKSTLLAAASAAKPKIANYPFTTIVPNLGICDISDEGSGLMLCDIPGLIEGASDGVGLGITFLRHVQRCRVLLHVIDGTSEDPIGDFNTINTELRKYDEFLANKPQVVVLNKVDVTEVKENEEELISKLKEAAGHSRVLSISAATKSRVAELMGRLKKFVDTQPVVDLPEPPQVDLSKAALDSDSDDFGELYGLYVLFDDLSIIIRCRTHFSCVFTFASQKSLVILHTQDNGEFEEITLNK
jgi:GTP-binding protein